MQFKQYEDGSCDIKFSWKERLVLFRKGRLHFSNQTFKNFGNALMQMIVSWHIQSNKDVFNKQTPTDTKINVSDSKNN
jgi:hypothetical protein